MKQLVVDSSVIIKWFNDEEGSEEAGKILEEIRTGETVVYCPELAKYEVTNALIKGKGLRGKKVRTILKGFYEIPILYVPDQLELANRAARLAVSRGITYYDAVFEALAKGRKIKLITANPKHQGGEKLGKSIM